MPEVLIGTGKARIWEAEKQVSARFTDEETLFKITKRDVEKAVLEIISVYPDSDSLIEVYYGEKPEFRQCKFYYGEEECPNYLLTGASFWWGMEMMSIAHGEAIHEGELTQLMQDYLYNRIYEPSASNPEIIVSPFEALKRYKRLYDLGKWDVGYLLYKKYPFDMEITEGNHTND